MTPEAQRLWMAYENYKQGQHPALASSTRDTVKVNLEDVIKEDVNVVLEILLYLENVQILQKNFLDSLLTLASWNGAFVDGNSWGADVIDLIVYHRDHVEESVVKRCEYLAKAYGVSYKVGASDGHISELIDIRMKIREMQKQLTQVLEQIDENIQEYSDVS